MLELFPIERVYVYGGSLKHKATELCLGLDNMAFWKVPVLVECSLDPENPKKGSDFALNFRKGIRYFSDDDKCLDAADMKFQGCHNGKGKFSMGHLRCRKFNKKYLLHQVTHFFKLFNDFLNYFLTLNYKF